ncbi:MAG: hypothetical protein QXO37_09430 [Candidatus Nitrosocaldaceae archaeon]
MRNELIEYFRWNRKTRVTLRELIAWYGKEREVALRVELARWRREGKIKVEGGEGRGRGKGRRRRIYVLTQGGIGYLAHKGIAI